MSKNVLVTGAAGFIGSNLIERLVRYGISVVGIDDYSNGSIDNHVRGVHSYINCSLVNKHEWITKLSCLGFIPDLVFHLGEYSRVTPSFSEIDNVVSKNLVSSLNILEYCRSIGIKIIYGASSTRFSNKGEGQNQSPYAWIKAKVVELIKNYSDWFDLQYAICYFYNVYGPRQSVGNKEWATVISIFEDQKRKGKPLTIVSPGTQIRDFTHVYDIVDGLILSADRETNDEYYLGTGRGYTLFDLARMFKSEYIMLPPRRGDRDEGIANIYDTTLKLGWKPKHNLEDWINEI